jgi:tRNA threonylcarbamoyladenosine biosynthesis protein TsaE
MSQINQDFTEDQLPFIAADILRNNPNARILAFYGRMGVGKTTLIKAICNQLDVSDIVGSPTFSIVNQYYTTNNETLYHFDFYRINKQEEVFDLGYEDYFFSGKYCFLEWPEKIESLLPDETTRIYLEDNDGLRNIRYQINNSNANL